MKQLEAAQSSFSELDREALHAIPLDFSVDGLSGVKAPEGMIAKNLTANMLMVSAHSPAITNIAQCVMRAHLDIAGIVAAPFASGLGVLVEDEMEQGATVIDMGGGLTTMASFYDNAMIFLDAMPAGGLLASADLAHALGTTQAAAERLKTLHGAVGLSDISAFEKVDAPRLGEDGRLEAGQVSRSDLSTILRPRMEEILEIMEMRLSKASRDGRPLPRRIVLTGGACQLPGMRDVAEAVFRAPVRLARPYKVAGLGEMHNTSAFATIAGLLKWSAAGGYGAGGEGAFGSEDEAEASLLRRATSWIRENF